MYYSVIVIGHQSLVPPELRNIGLKVSFINSEGKVETWEFQDGTFTDVSGWKQQVQKNRNYEVETRRPVTGRSQQHKCQIHFRLGWQKGNRDYTTGAFKEGPYFVSDIVNVEGESFDFQTERMRILYVVTPQIMVHPSETANGSTIITLQDTPMSLSFSQIPRIIIPDLPIRMSIQLHKRSISKMRQKKTWIIVLKICPVKFLCSTGE